LEFENDGQNLIQKNYRQNCNRQFWMKSLLLKGLLKAIKQYFHLYQNGPLYPENYGRNGFIKSTPADQEVRQPHGDRHLCPEVLGAAGRPQDQAEHLQVHHEVIDLQGAASGTTMNVAVKSCFFGGGGVGGGDLVFQSMLFANYCIT
jgi:hypothetical protein